MSRLPRVVVPGLPHHITQRGNHRQDVFLTDDDRRVYLSILRDSAKKAQVEIVAWCLMSNHVHLVAIPELETSLALALGRAHRDYARWLHIKQDQVGHLWQNRFYSCTLERHHLWEAIRYVELNPVRAKMIDDPAAWQWSSAELHTSGIDRWQVTSATWWQNNWGGANWKETLQLGLDESANLARIREATRTGRPLGSSGFVQSLETQLGRHLRPQKRGRKPRSNSVTAYAFPNSRQAEIR